MGREALCGRSPVYTGTEGDQPLDVLDKGSECELFMHSGKSPSPSSSQTVTDLALGEEVFRALAQFLGDQIAGCIEGAACGVSDLYFVDTGFTFRVTFRNGGTGFPDRQRFRGCIE